MHRNGMWCNNINACSCRDDRHLLAMLIGLFTYRWEWNSASTERHIALKYAQSLCFHADDAILFRVRQSYLAVAVALRVTMKANICGKSVRYHVDPLVNLNDFAVYGLQWSSNKVLLPNSAWVISYIACEFWLSNAKTCRHVRNRWRSADPYLNV
jgi:hypothetical protein